MNADTYFEILARETYRQYTFRAESYDAAVQWQRAFRADLRRLLGLEQIELRGKAELCASLLGSEPQRDHVREEWVLQTEPGFYLPFFLLKPLLATEKLPLVVTPHGHGRLGKQTYVGMYETEEDKAAIAEGERDIALQAVREGYMALAPDMRGLASLRRREDVDADVHSCRTLQMHAQLFGRTLVGERVWDVLQLITWALQRKDVDPNSVIVTGNSGGGTVTLFAAAIDARIRIAVPGSYFCTFQHSIGAIRHCECNYVPGILRLGEMYDVAGLIAPRPFLAVAGEEDQIFPATAVKAAYAHLHRIYGVFGAEEACHLSMNKGGHRYYKKDVWPFVRSMLAKSQGSVG